MCVLGVRCLCRHNTSSSSCILPHRGKLLIIKQHIVTCVLTSKNHLHFQCYYIGAADISATKLVREVTKPLAFGKPTEKICEALKKKDEQICELRYGRNQPLSYIIGERERANLVVQTPQYFYYPRLYVVQLRMHQDYAFFIFTHLMSLPNLASERLSSIQLSGNRCALRCLTEAVLLSNLHSSKLQVVNS